MAYPYSPFALAPAPLPTAEELLAGFIPASAPTPGSLMAPPGQLAREMDPGPRASSLGASLQALGAGILAPLGAPTPGYTMQDVPSLSDAETLPTPVRGTDLNEVMAQDPTGAMIGGMVGMGPALRLAGMAGRGVMSIPGMSEAVGATGRTLAKPAVGVPLALGGSLMATTGEAQAPTAMGARTSEAQTALESARKRLADVEGERRRLQERVAKFDPENISRLSESDIKEAQTAVGTTADGKIGPRTRAAVEEHRRRLQAEIAALQPRETTARTDIKTAEDRRTQAEQMDLQDAGRKALEESQPGFLEQWGPTVGAYGLGAVGGHALRNLLARGTTQRAAAQKAEVDAISAQMGQGDIPTRVGRLNELWTEGNRRSAPPFAFVPSGSPTLHTPSQVAPWSSVTHEVAPGMMGGQATRTVMPPDQLYRPSLGTLYGPTAATMGVGGIESAGAQFLMLPGAQRELEAAQAAMERQGPTPENVDRLTSARRQVAIWEAMQNLGRGVAGGALTAEMMHPLRSLPRPSMAAAEAERGALDMALHPKAPPPPPLPPGPPPPGPVWDARVGRWRLNGGFVAAPIGAPRGGPRGTP